jgi:hypothetical protein
MLKRADLRFSPPVIEDTQQNHLSKCQKKSRITCHDVIDVMFGNPAFQNLFYSGSAIFRAYLPISLAN